MGPPLLQLHCALLYLFDAEGGKGDVHPAHPFLIFAPDSLPIPDESEGVLGGAERVQAPYNIPNHD